MTYIEWLRLAYTLAPILWTVAAVVFTRVYFQAWWINRRRHLPFLLSAVWIGCSCLVESLFYAITLWVFPENVALRRAAILVIPIALITQALAYMAFALWIRSLRGK